MKHVHYLFLIMVAAIAGSCSQEEKETELSFSGLVIIKNSCNMSFNELPSRIKVNCSINGKPAAEQDLETEKLDQSSKTASYSFTFKTKLSPEEYSLTATRPNGKSICLQLPCPSARKCSDHAEFIPVKFTDSKAYLDTIVVDCGCSF